MTAGRVSLGVRVCTKPATQVRDEDELSLVGDPDRYVGRAAHKLAYAVERFAGRGLQVAGARCLDVGASTGGFTQVLLEHEADCVVALDVGHGQLAAPLAADPRVVNREGTNIREVAPGDLGDPFDLVVADLSFISVTLVLPTLRALTAPDGQAVLLVKPQFEVGRGRLGRRGVVTSADQRRHVLLEVVEQAVRSGFSVRDLVASPLPGQLGNREYLLWVSATPAPVDPTTVQALVAQVCREEEP